MNKIAIVQRPPVLLDRSATLAVAIESIGEAAAAGASLNQQRRSPGFAGEAVEV